jgi:hypothetical protein
MQIGEYTTTQRVSNNPLASTSAKTLIPSLS